MAGDDCQLVTCFVEASRVIVLLNRSIQYYAHNYGIIPNLTRLNHLNFLGPINGLQIQHLSSNMKLSLNLPSSKDPSLLINIM